MGLSRKQKKAIADLKAVEVAAYTRKQIDELRKIYRQATKDLQRVLLSTTATSLTKKSAAKTLANVKIITKALEVDVVEWGEDILPLSYNRGVDVAERQVLRLGISDSVARTAALHTAAIGVLADSLAVDVVKVSGEITHLAGSFIRRAQLDSLMDQELSRQVAQGIIKGDGFKQSGSRLLQAYRERIAEGAFVRIGGRNYQLDKYLELVAQTRTREATTEGTINTAVQYGMDIGIWDVHDNPCPQCQRFSGRVFSISGTHPDFLRLDVRPPVHPRCECSFHPTTETKLRDTDMYDKLVALSKNPNIPILNQGDYESILGRKPLEIAKAEANVLGNLEEAMAL